MLLSPTAWQYFCLPYCCIRWQTLFGMKRGAICGAFFWCVLYQQCIHVNISNHIYLVNFFKLPICARQIFHLPFFNQPLFSYGVVLAAAILGSPSVHCLGVSWYRHPSPWPRILYLQLGPFRFQFFRVTCTCKWSSEYVLVLLTIASSVSHNFLCVYITGSVKAARVVRGIMDSMVVLLCHSEVPLGFFR